MKNLNDSLFLILFSLFFLMQSCGGPPPEAPVVVDPKSTTEAPLSGTFYLVAYQGLTTTPYTSHKLLAGDSSWSQPCSVSAAELNTTNANISCLIEAHELDLYAQGTTLTASFPQNACEYVSETPYFYFKYLPGVGAPGPLPYSAANPTCIYDYRPQKGPNCCTGTWAMNSGVDPTSQPARSGKYGGDFSNCYGGPALKDMGKNNGIPATQLYQNLTAGGKISRSLKGLFDLPADERVFSNVQIANYYTPSDHSHLTNNPTLVGTAPIAFDYQSDSFTGINYPTSPFYVYTCYDTDQEIKARITLQIREWNTISELHQGGNPNVSGLAPNGEPYNDYKDWKDFGDAGSTVFPGISN